jgi:hypothetical protein
VIIRRIPRSADLREAPCHDVGESLAPQALRAFRDLDKVVWGLRVVDKVSESTCRSMGLLTDQVHLTETSRTLVGGDPWVPMSLSCNLSCLWR